MSSMKTKIEPIVAYGLFVAPATAPYTKRELYSVQRTRSNDILFYITEPNDPIDDLIPPIGISYLKPIFIVANQQVHPYIYTDPELFEAMECYEKAHFNNVYSDGELIEIDPANLDVFLFNPKKNIEIQCAKNMLDSAKQHIRRNSYDSIYFCKI